MNLLRRWWRGWADTIAASRREKADRERVARALPDVEWCRWMNTPLEDDE